MPIYSYNTVTCYTNTRNITKRQRQWARWKDEIVPSLIKPYLAILNQMCNLRDPPSSPLPRTCTCITTRKLKVLCVYFDREWSDFSLDTCCNNCLSLDLSQIELLLCACTPAALQLMSQALFPCAPLFPSLAIDINLLDFVKKLFLCMPHNVTDWCETLEDFLGRREYQLNTQVGSMPYLALNSLPECIQPQEGLQKCFTQALQWFSMLQVQMKDLVQTVVNSGRDLDAEHSRSLTSPPSPSSPSPSPSSLPAFSATPEPGVVPSSSDPDSESSNSEDLSESKPLHASLYLRHHCPLCFGKMQLYHPCPEYIALSLARYLYLQCIVPT